MAPTDNCDSCGAVLPAEPDRTCVRCGWDGRSGVRVCIKCKGPVPLQQPLGWKAIAAIVGLGSAILWPVMGLLLGVAALCLVGAVCAVSAALGLEYRCTPCAFGVQPSLLARKEQAEIRHRRIGFAAGAALLLAVAGVFLMLFLDYLKDNPGALKN